MILTFKQLPKVLVYEKGKKKKYPLGKVVDCVVNPKTGIFEAFWVMTFDGMKLLLRKDISNWDQFSLEVLKKDCFVEVSSQVRLRKIIENEIPILKSKVFCNQKYLGKVVNFSFDTVSPRILHLYVRGGMFHVRRFIIHASRIYKIDTHGIHIWDNATIKSLKKHVKDKDVATDVSSTASEYTDK